MDWTEVERQVAATVRRRRVPSDRAAEITQTTLERVLVAMVPRWRTEDALRFGVRVATNLVIDERRRKSAELVDEIPERSGYVDVEALVLSRLELARVGRALEELSDRDRAILLDFDPPTLVDARARTRAKVQRHRARARLRELLESAGAWIAGHPLVRRAIDVVHTAETSGVVREVVAVAVVAMAIVASPADPAPHAVLAAVASSAVGHRPGAAPADAAPPPTPRAIVEPSTARSAPKAPKPGDRPAWVNKEPERTIAEVPHPDGRPGYVWYWDEDPQNDEDPLVCVWSRPLGTEVCAPATWGDAREVSPVPIDPPV